MADDLLTRFRALPGADRVLRALTPDEEVYAVGGTVRDLLLGRRPVDIDLAVAVGVPAIIAGRLGAAPTVHTRFDTASVLTPDRRRYDLAATRRERYPRPGALPEVARAPIEEDLARRDFTVSALALGLSGPRLGELLAAPGAREDLADRRLRVLHDASFRDDPTRLLRLARYGARLGFTVEPLTNALARHAVVAGALTTVSGPRTGSEVELLAHEPERVAGFERLRTHGVDAALAPGFGIEDPDAVRRGLALLGPQGCGGALALGAALLGVPEPERRPLLDRWGTEAHLRRGALAVARDAPRLAAALPVDGPASDWMRLTAHTDGEAVTETVALAGGLGGAAAEKDVRRWQTAIGDARLDIDGRDLIAAGLRPGPIMRVALSAALAAKVDGNAPDRESQLAAALRAARGGG